jgi:hypothetical protein
MARQRGEGATVSKLTTADCKEFLAEFGSAKWKRKRKAKDDDGHVLRVFTDGVRCVVIDSGPDDESILSATIVENTFDIDLNALKDPGRPWLRRDPTPTPKMVVDATTMTATPMYPRKVDEPLHPDWHELLDDGEPVPQSSTEFVFHVGEFDGMVIASICLRRYWEKHGHLDDRSLANQYAFALGFDEICESEFEFDGTVEEARKILLEAGMTEDPKFGAFMEGCRG